jgi:osomolarity two-component system sensor histidine kinase SLN1
MLTATLKSAQLSSTLLLMQVLVKQASMRLAPQMALESYYRDDRSTDDQWDRTAEDYDAIFAGDENTRIAVQARIYHKEGSDRILFNRTASSVANVTLPYEGSDGQPALMGDYLYG